MAMDSETCTLIQILAQSADKCTKLVRLNGSSQLYIQKTINREVPAYLLLRRAQIPGVPQIYRVRVDSGRTEVMEEFLNGKTLEEYVKLNGLLTPKEAEDILIRLCRILVPLHNRGIIHRDIKPANIIRSPDGGLYLIDFDAARQFRAAQDRDTVLLGTRGYAAPEQYGYAPTDQRTDIYALGVMINRLMTGKLPGEKLADSHLLPIIRKCTQLDPQARYHSCNQILSQLTAPAADYAAYSPPVSAASPAHSPPIRERREWWRILAAGITAILYMLVEFTEKPFGLHTLSDYCFDLIIILPPVCYAVDLLKIRTRPPLPFPRIKGGKTLFVILYFTIWVALILIVNTARTNGIFS